MLWVSWLSIWVSPQLQVTTLPTWTAEGIMRGIEESRLSLRATHDAPPAPNRVSLRPQAQWFPFTPFRPEPNPLRAR